MGKPVGGIAVVRHFELGVCPLQIFLTYEVVKAFIDFGAPFQRLAAGNVNPLTDRTDVLTQLISLLIPSIFLALLY
jgi:hypothetical protein